MVEKEKLYLIEARCPSLDVDSKEFDNFITSNEDFKKFCQEVFDLEDADLFDPVFLRYIKRFERVSVCMEKVLEDRDIQGIQKVVETKKGKVKVGYTRVRENRIYIENKGVYLRGYKVFWADLCLVGAMDFVPLDKSLGNGNIEILQWNKRKSTKGIRFIHNKVQSIMYVVDMEFSSLEEMQKDIANPKDLNLTSLIEPLL